MRDGLGRGDRLDGGLAIHPPVGRHRRDPRPDRHADRVLARLHPAPLATAGGGPGRAAAGAAPTVLGFYLLVAMGPNGPLGALYEGATGRMLPFTFEGLLIASVLFSLPFAVQPFTVAFSSVDRALIEASWTLGRSRAATFVRIILPLSSGGVVAGLVLAFAHTLGEFGVVLMVGGNIAGQTRTISIAIYDRVQALDYTAAAATALPLLLISFTVLALTYSLRGTSLLLWPRRH